MTAEYPATPSLTGSVLSRKWRVGSKLGEGGMGEVYSAEPVGGGAGVALKVLRPEFLLEPPVLARFLEEGRTCSALAHPNIVRVFECGEAEDRRPYLVMERLQGVPLAAYTAGGGRVPLPQAVPILHGILAGLAAAHAQGIVHRDLKPDNVFLTRDAAQPGTFAVKLLDFGLAKVMDVAGGMGSKTRNGVLLGTPSYMSPEQIKNARDVDPRADLFSAGVLFYEMLTGRPAFPAPTEFAKLTAVLTTEPEPLERVDPALSPLGPFLARALKKNRDERFASAQEMARALSASAPGHGPQPLSRLPEVASVFAPSVDVGSTLPSTFVAPVAQEAVRSPGSTLTSRAALGLPPAQAQPGVAIADAAPGATLPSEDLPMLEPPGSGTHGVGMTRRGVAPVVVAVLVAAAFFAGMLLGWGLPH
jgi:serine/threonine-protein kinase